MRGEPEKQNEKEHPCCDPCRGKAMTMEILLCDGKLIAPSAKQNEDGHPCGDYCKATVAKNLLSGEKPITFST